MSRDDWKQKYLDQLDQNEHQEQRWREEKHTLQRLLVRATLAAEGQDRRMDEVLAELRDLARSDDPARNELLRLQNQLEELVSGFDERRTGAVKALQNVLGELTRPLIPYAEGDSRRALKRFSRDHRQQVAQFTGLPEVLQQLAQLQEEVLSAVDEAGQKERPGLLKRLFGGDDRASQEPDTNGTEENGGGHEGLPAQNGTPEMELDTGEPADSSDVEHLGNRLGELLRQLRTQVSLPERAEQRVQELETRVAGSTDLDQVRHVLDEMAQLIVSAVGRGQREFEQFLANLDERLVRIQAEFQDGALNLESWQELSDQYDRELHQEIDDMGRNAQAATDLSSLQGTVQQHIDRLSNTLSEFRNAGSEREQHLKDQVQSLQEKVSALEAQSDGIKEELREERRRATTDMLTQLPNREAMEERMQQEYERWQRYRQPLSLAILDIDHFKPINDTYGHLAGDKVLQLLARSLRENLRQADFIARYGGEEFIVLMPGTTAETAYGVIDKLRERVRSLPFHFRRERVEITFSAGVVGFSDDIGAHGLLDVADRALYRAKENGRNQVMLAEERDHRPLNPSSR